MKRARSIKQNTRSDRLPDFCRMGTVLRIVLLVNGFALFGIITEASSVAEGTARALQLSAWLQPVLLSSLLLLYGLNGWLARLSYWTGVAWVMAIAVLTSLAITRLGGDFFSPPGASEGFSLARDALVSLLSAAFLLGYFSVRAQILSPARHDARLQALQARIRPHFLFNSINAVLSIVRSQPKRAETALEDMADLFRMAMSGDTDLVALTQEITLAKQYLALESLRLGERLRVDWTLDAPTDALIPPLILQPLLENAVYHGIEPLAEGGLIRVTIQCDGKQLLLEVINPIGDYPTRMSGNGMAVTNIRERLALQFDVEAHYDVEILPGTYCVRLQIPYLRESRQ